MSKVQFEILKSKYYQNYQIPSYSRVTGFRDTERQQIPSPSIGFARKHVLSLVFNICLK